jgi:hypothetical protein
MTPAGYINKFGYRQADAIVQRLENSMEMKAQRIVATNKTPAGAAGVLEGAKK